MKNLRSRIHKQRLRETRRPGDQAMPAGKKRDEDLIDDVGLAHDDLAQFPPDPGARGSELFDGLLVGGSGRRLLSHGPSKKRNWRGRASLSAKTDLDHPRSLQ